MSNYELIADKSNIHWGFYDASLRPALTINDGDTVVFYTESGRKDLVGTLGDRVSSQLIDIFSHHEQAFGAHIMTGPVFINGAKEGDVLEVNIKDIQTRYDWGYNGFRPLVGGLPDDFPYSRVVIIDIDKEKGIADWGAGVKVPIKPFFGNFGVAPPKSYGKVPSTPPAAWGGNTDNKEFVTGTKIFFPIFNDGALFSVGDGHGCQGDGEANINGIEMGLIGTFEFKVRKDLSINLPVAESETHHIFMGFDPVLDNAAKIALRETIYFLKNSKGLHPDDAYTLCSLAVDLRVTQIVNGYKGVHAMLPKSIF
ncbi:MAG: acetamidase/formamidase family protein [bacterium]